MEATAHGARLLAAVAFRAPWPPAVTSTAGSTAQVSYTDKSSMKPNYFLRRSDRTAMPTTLSPASARVDGSGTGTRMLKN
jgi:hypothetical protein